jgi:hypothetical protein
VSFVSWFAKIPTGGIGKMMPTHKIPVAVPVPGRDKKFIEKILILLPGKL